MITARIFIEPMKNRLAFDMYLGSDSANPIYVSEITKVNVERYEQHDCILLRVHKNDDISLARCDRLLLQKDLDKDVATIPQILTTDDRFMSKIRTFELKWEEEKP